MQSLQKKAETIGVNCAFVYRTRTLNHTRAARLKHGQHESIGQIKRRTPNRILMAMNRIDRAFTVQIWLNTLHTYGLLAFVVMKREMFWNKHVMVSDPYSCPPLSASAYMKRERVEKCTRFSGDNTSQQTRLVRAAAISAVPVMSFKH